MNGLLIDEVFNSGNQEGSNLKVDVIHKLNLSSGYILILGAFLLIYLFATIAKFNSLKK